ncbi:hypothetical protein SAMN06265173_12645 [Thalassovita litoralis]|uniref:Uncharacterized protein n=1 Tax=Thalassovita litoralis TaxID=1010611 RepID=A0A521FBY0_9RHOB|nr:hypothetical protein SAMN06265173_12645 [Thalassovita litoralis]
MQLSMFSQEVHPANPSVLRGLEWGWLTQGAISCSPLALLQKGIAPAGWFGRTSPASCRATKDGTLVPSSGCWGNSGMGPPTEFLTLSTCEHAASPLQCLNGDVVCSLSDILETGDVPQRYYLTAKACLGILRRAGKRGKLLPQALRLALEAVAGKTAQKDA